MNYLVFILSLIAFMSVYNLEQISRNFVANVNPPNYIEKTDLSIVTNNDYCLEDTKQRYDIGMLGSTTEQVIEKKEITLCKNNNHILPLNIRDGFSNDMDLVFDKNGNAKGIFQGYTPKLRYSPIVLKTLSMDNYLRINNGMYLSYSFKIDGVEYETNKIRYAYYAGTKQQDFIKMMCTMGTTVNDLIDLTPMNIIVLSQDPTKKDYVECLNSTRSKIGGYSFSLKEPNLTFTYLETSGVLSENINEGLFINYGGYNPLESFDLQDKANIENYYISGTVKQITDFKINNYGRFGMMKIEKFVPLEVYRDVVITKEN